MKNRRPPSVTSWNSLLKLTSRLQSSQTLTVSSTQRSVEKYIFVSPHLPDLPEIVWKRILSNLDSKSLSHCTCLCKSLHEIALHPDLWQMQCILAKVDCGPGIEQLLDKVDGHKGKWWREVYIRGIMKRQGWLTGNYKKRLIGLSDVDDVITCFKFDNDKVIIGTRKHKVKLFQSNIADFWNSPVAKHSAMYQGAHKSAIMCLDFSSSNGNILATGDADGTLAVWNIFTGDLLARQKRAHEKGISQVIMLDNRHIATCGFDKTIRIFRLLEYTIGAKQEYSPTSSRSSSVCPEQTVKRKGISRLFPSKVELIRPKTLVTMVKEFRGHRGEVYCMQALAKKTKLATGSTDHTIKVLLFH
jgi:WD40 repeat protein